MDNDGLTRTLARIERTTLGFEDHGILTAFLHVNYGAGVAQGIGGYSLRSIAGPWIEGVLSACGVQAWEQLRGRTIFVLTDDARRVLGIEPLPFEPGTPFRFSDIGLEGQSS